MLIPPLPTSFYLFVDREMSFLLPEHSGRRALLETSMCRAMRCCPRGGRGPHQVRSSPGTMENTTEALLSHWSRDRQPACEAGPVSCFSGVGWRLECRRVSWYMLGLATEVVCLYRQLAPAHNCPVFRALGWAAQSSLNEARQSENPGLFLRTLGTHGGKNTQPTSAMCLSQASKLHQPLDICNYRLAACTSWGPRPAIALGMHCPDPAAVPDDEDQTRT